MAVGKTEMKQELIEKNLIVSSENHFIAFSLLCITEDMCRADSAIRYGGCVRMTSQRSVSLTMCQAVFRTCQYEV